VGGAVLVLVVSGEWSSIGIGGGGDGGGGGGEW
jgi:hypothetical protein